MSQRIRLGVIVLVALAGSLLAGSPLAAQTTRPAAAAQAPTPQQSRFDRRSPVVVAVERVKDAVVNISSTRLVKVRFGSFDDEMFERFFGGLGGQDPFSRTVQATSLGSGVIIHPAGYMLTNAHVVARASEITCSLAGNETSKFDAKIVSMDPAFDLAVLKIAAPGAKPLPHIPMGRSGDLMIGETVIAIGNAMGYSHTVTTGVVSAVERKVQLTAELTLEHLIQTDASINPGNSGGPLLNINGELIGINTAIRGDAHNIGFAIPIDVARRELAVLLDFARINDVYLGATLGDRDGVLIVEEVATKSPAAEAGLAAGDLVGSMDRRPCGSLMEFNVRMMDKPAGSTFELEVARRDKSGQVKDLTLRIKLAAAARPDGNELLWSRFGMKVRPIDSETARRPAIRPGAGLLVSQMAQDCQAAGLGIQVGDVLFQVEKLTVSSADELGQALKKVQPGETINMGFLRGRFQLWTRLKAK